MAAAAVIASPTTSSLEDLSPAYKELVPKLHTIVALEFAKTVLSYDQMVSMPKAAAAARGAQLAAVSTVIHEKATDPAIGTLLETALADLQAAGGKEKFPEEQHILSLSKDEYDRKTRIPAELVAKRASLSSSAHAAWVAARQGNTFDSFQPSLQDTFDTGAAVARAIRTDESLDLYSVMMDEYERGMPMARLNEIFDHIERDLKPLLDRVLNSTYKPDAACRTGDFPVKAQQEMNRKIVTALGFDETRGRIDVSVHPFTMPCAAGVDIRITSRFKEGEWADGLIGSIHESGHAMYEQYRIPKTGLAPDKYLSLGCHESQSLFWERHIAKSLPFWTYAIPVLKESFPDFSYTPQQVYEAVNTVNPGLVRVEADELTYPFHIILRYHIERDVVEGKLAVADIPKVWNTKMKELLNVDVPSDTLGCLQDVHWGSQSIGYFPTYLLGSTMAAQLAYYIRKDLPTLDELVATGNFLLIREWLTDKVHRHGRRYASLDALLEDQFGEKLNPTYFIDYLTEKYTKIYKC